MTPSLVCVVVAILATLTLIVVAMTFFNLLMSALIFKAYSEILKVMALTRGDE